MYVLAVTHLIKKLIYEVKALKGKIFLKINDFVFFNLHFCTFWPMFHHYWPVKHMNHRYLLQCIYLGYT